jgi:hypothetical protein
MVFNSVRNYLAERIVRLKREWQIYQSTGKDPVLTEQRIHDFDTHRMYQSVYHSSRDPDLHRTLNNELTRLVEAYRIDYQSRDQPFELRRPFTPADKLPDNRIPAPGLIHVPYMYHSGHIIHENPATSRPLHPDYETDYAESYLPGDIDFGHPVDPLIQRLLDIKWTQYRPFVFKYCRPAGTTNGTFRDFNKAQKPTAPLDPVRKEHVLKHIFRLLDATPYLPLHFVDTQFAKLPLITGTGYHNRFSFKQRAHAKYSHPPEYAERPTSKGYFYNATYENARTLIHRIKETGFPFPFDIPEDLETLTDSRISQLIASYESFFLDYPTLLFTRNHISEREGTLKVRPVYAVDDIFLLIEVMLTFPLLVQARKPSCCIMYGLETIRGANRYLDRLAYHYKSFFTIDWSGFDQRVPRVITDLFFTDFLRRLIVINHGYTPTYEYPTYPDLTEHTLYKKMDNLLHFLHLWFNNMVFLSVDGYAYWRTSAGISSGQLTTQYIDSFADLYFLIDGMIEFGFTDSEIEELVIFVLGDDNSGFTNWDLSRLHSFIVFLEKYALQRYNMVLSHTKSVITMMRNKIETLGYRCNFGQPRRDIGKLVAQLCYPEHGIKYHTMSARAIGIAYAACGMDPDFHKFCYDVFCTFLPYHRPDPRSTLYLERLLSKTEEIRLPFETENLHFPSLETVITQISSYQGPLSFEPKWNYAHFVNSPDIIPPDAKTMYDYEIEHSLRPRQSPTLRQADIMPFL